MGEKKQPVYDESKIKTLSSLEHIRLRSGMYIGRLGNGKDPDDGIYVLLKEIIAITALMNSSWGKDGGFLSAATAGG